MHRYDEAGHGFGVGRLTSVTDAAGTLSRSYDERGDVVSEKRVQGSLTLSTSYGYDAVQRVVSIGYPSGSTAIYTRDAMGRVTGISTQPTGAGAKLVPVISSITYQPFGPPTALTYGNGVTETRTFDADYRETLRADTGKTPVQKLGYAYDPADNVSGITDSVTAGNSQAFGYDVLNRLTSAKGGYGTLAYRYDAIGNRLAEDSTATFATLDGLGAVSSLSYNQAGRVSSVTAGGQQVAGYVYDVFGHRLARTGTNATVYQYDLGGHLLEEADGQATRQADYIYLGDQAVASVASSGNVYFFHNDRLGTPQAATDGNQALMWQASYQPFGVTSTGVGLITQDLRLPGQEFDNVTSLNHNGFREYLPGLGRYLQSDPLSLLGGLNNYTYAHSNPINAFDPLGAEPQTTTESLSRLTDVTGLAGLFYDRIVESATVLIDRGIAADLFDARIGATQLAEEISQLEEFKGVLAVIGKGVGIIDLTTNGYLFFEDHNLNTTIDFGGSFLGLVPGGGWAVSGGIFAGKNVLYPSVKYLTKQYYPGAYAGFLEDAYDVLSNYRQSLSNSYRRFVDCGGGILAKFF